jgi:hypothetical protein
MANLAAGTQAGGLCAQRVCNPLVHGISQAYLFLPSTECNSAGRTGYKPVFREQFSDA